MRRSNYKSGDIVKGLTLISRTIVKDRFGRPKTAWHTTLPWGEPWIVRQDYFPRVRERTEIDSNSTFNSLFRSYKIGAKRRKLIWELTKEQFKFLTKSNCYYCGIEPKTEYWKKYALAKSYIYNGIDRVDNNKGYIVNNCQACCKKCNKMKMILTTKDFLDQIEKIYKFQNKI